MNPARYLLRHWRGELSLPVSYWINSSLLGAVVGWSIYALLTNLPKTDIPLRALSATALIAIPLNIGFWVWALVGVWRSAGHHAERGGSAGWAAVARIMVALGVLSLAGRTYTNLIPQAREHILIALGRDPLGEFDIKVSDDGKSILLTGTLREGVAARMRAVLQDAPGATTVVLNSNGGRLIEAERLARLVRARKLNTYVEYLCASACTYVFLAGRDRSATPNAKIGFHRPGLAGPDAISQDYLTQSMLDFYREAGLPEAFIQHIGATPTSSIWYPSRAELIAAHVITRVSLGGERDVFGTTLQSRAELRRRFLSEPLFRAYEKRLPGLADKAVDRAWAVKMQGGRDGDIMSAMRQVVADALPLLLKTADDTTLDLFAALMVDELSAARALSAEACGRLLTAKLDISQTLPPAVVEQDKEVMRRAATAPPRADRRPPDPARLQALFRKVAGKLPPNYKNVIGNMDHYADQPGLVCDAVVAFYQQIRALPVDERHLVLRGMFQNNG